MKKLGKKGEVISVDGLTLQIEKAGENNAVCAVVSDGAQQSYHLASRDGQIAAGRTERSAQLALRRKLFGAAAAFSKKVQLFSKICLTTPGFSRIIAHVERLTPQNTTEYWGFA